MERGYTGLLDTLRQQDRNVSLSDLYDEVLSLGPDRIKPFGVNEFKARVVWRSHLEAPSLSRRARGYLWLAGVLLFHVIALSWIGAVLLIVTAATQSVWLTTNSGVSYFLACLA